MICWPLFNTKHLFAATSIFDPFKPTNGSLVLIIFSPRQMPSLNMNRFRAGPLNNCREAQKLFGGIFGFLLYHVQRSCPFAFLHTVRIFITFTITPLLHYSLSVCSRRVAIVFFSCLLLTLEKARHFLSSLEFFQQPDNVKQTQKAFWIFQI